MVKEVLVLVLNREVMRPVENLGDGNRFVVGGGPVEEARDQRGIENEILNQDVGAVVMALGRRGRRRLRCRRVGWRR